MSKPAVPASVQSEIETFREALVKWRKKKGLVRTEAVKGIGVSAQQLCHIENGTGLPSLPVFLALRRAMGLPPIFAPRSIHAPQTGAHG